MASGCALGTIPTGKGEKILISQDLKCGLPLVVANLSVAYMAFYPQSQYFDFALVLALFFIALACASLEI